MVSALTITPQIRCGCLDSCSNNDTTSQCRNGLLEWWWFGRMSHVIPLLPTTNLSHTSCHSFFVRIKSSGREADCFVPRQSVVQRQSVFDLCRFRNTIRWQNEIFLQKVHYTSLPLAFDLARSWLTLETLLKPNTITPSPVRLQPKNPLWLDTVQSRYALETEWHWFC